MNWLEAYVPTDNKSNWAHMQKTTSQAIKISPEVLA